MMIFVRGQNGLTQTHEDQMSIGFNFAIFLRRINAKIQVLMPKRSTRLDRD